MKDPAERPEDKPVRTAGGAAAPLCSHCGVITMSMGSQLSAGPQSLQIIDVSENEEDVFTIRVSLKQPGRRRRKEGRRRKRKTRRGGGGGGAVNLHSVLVEGDFDLKVDLISSLLFVCLCHFKPASNTTSAALKRPRPTALITQNPTVHRET